MDDVPALLTLGIAAVSPFAVILSRKIWNPDLMLSGVLLVLWGIEWLRGDQPWRGLACIVFGGLFVGQLNHSGTIAMLLLPVAIGVQHLVDRRRGVEFRMPRPSPVDVVWLVEPMFDHHGGFPIHWMDVALPAGLLGIWLFLFARNLGSRALLPLNDPFFKEAFAHDAH